MYYNYEIRNNGSEDILYLYLTMKYEFSNELNYFKDKDVGRRTKNFIINNNIPFKGSKVFLIVDGIIVKTIDISYENNNIKSNYLFSCDNFIINIRLDDNSLCEIILRDYLLSILLSKYMDNLEDEVLKAITVLYNTYAYKMMKENNFISSNNSFAIYKPLSYYKIELSNYDYIINRLNHIIDEVDCIHICYKKNYILPFIHYSNDGKTKSNSKYPYLSSIKSLWDLASPYYVDIKDVSYSELESKLSIKVNCNSKIQVYKKDNTLNISFDKELFQIEEIRKKLDLKSNEIHIIIYKNYLRFITCGWGNSLGLSIFGANEIARDGAKYYNILKYYFPKTELFKYIKELS